MKHASSSSISGMAIFGVVCFCAVLFFVGLKYAKARNSGLVLHPPRSHFPSRRIVFVQEEISILLIPVFERIALIDGFFTNETISFLDARPNSCSKAEQASEGQARSRVRSIDFGDSKVYPSVEDIIPDRAATALTLIWLLVCQQGKTIFSRA